MIQSSGTRPVARRPRRRAAVVAAGYVVAVSAVICIHSALASAEPTSDTTTPEQWFCRQPSGEITLTDTPHSGCTPIVPTQDNRSPSRSAQRRADPPTAQSLQASIGTRTVQHRPFPAATRQVLSLAVHPDYTGPATSRWSQPEGGAVHEIAITLSYLPAGNGPLIESDRHLQDSARSAFRQAVVMAAGAVGYDPRYIRGRLTMPNGLTLHSDVRAGGPSAGAIWTIAVASILLEDSLRENVCMTGTIEPGLRVGRIGGAEAKMDACIHAIRNGEMIIPMNQQTPVMQEMAWRYGVHISEVEFLADAYTIVTGQPLRLLQ
ncbi:MAG: S16 family serine protease [Nitrospiraceae bacterium]